MTKEEYTYKVLSNIAQLQEFYDKSILDNFSDMVMNAGFNIGLIFVALNQVLRNELRITPTVIPDFAKLISLCHFECIVNPPI